MSFHETENNSLLIIEDRKDNDDVKAKPKRSIFQIGKSKSPPVPGAVRIPSGRTAYDSELLRRSSRAISNVSSVHTIEPLLSRTDRKLSRNKARRTPKNVSHSFEKPYRRSSQVQSNRSSNFTGFTRPSRLGRFSTGRNLELLSLDSNCDIFEGVSFFHKQRWSTLSMQIKDDLLESDTFSVPLDYDSGVVLLNVVYIPGSKHLSVQTLGTREVQIEESRRVNWMIGAKAIRHTKSKPMLLLKHDSFLYVLNFDETRVKNNLIVAISSRISRNYQAFIFLIGGEVLTDSYNEESFAFRTADFKDIYNKAHLKYKMNQIIVSTTDDRASWKELDTRMVNGRVLTFYKQSIRKVLVLCSSCVLAYYDYSIQGFKFLKCTYNNFSSSQKETMKQYARNIETSYMRILREMSNIIMLVKLNSEDIESGYILGHNKKKTHKIWMKALKEKIKKHQRHDQYLKACNSLMDDIEGII